MHNCYTVAQAPSILSRDSPNWGLRILVLVLVLVLVPVPVLVLVLVPVPVPVRGPGLHGVPGSPNLHASGVSVNSSVNFSLPTACCFLGPPVAHRSTLVVPMICARADGDSAECTASWPVAAHAYGTCQRAKQQSEHARVGGGRGSSELGWSGSRHCLRGDNLSTCLVLKMHDRPKIRDFVCACAAAAVLVKL